ncbi:preprotein translocase subunit SecA [Rubripirellula amarantea]|nr:preprotein translocase subunit SecA [Rubripirellula amarantea]
MSFRFPWPRSGRFNEQAFVDAVRRQTESLAKHSSKMLASETCRLRDSQANVKHDSIIDAVALITEAVRRVTGKTYYDVQLIAGSRLAQGRVAEIQTGEGKTLITAIPAFVFALAGRGVHVATTNDYLSRRDYETTRPAFRLLGLTIAHLDTGQEAGDKRIAYGCDITYGPGYEFGFDYLRDQIERRKGEAMRLGDRFVERIRGQHFQTTASVQRPCAFAIIDEADSVLIDEANTPLVLGGQDPGPQTDPALYRIADQFALSLSEGQDYRIQNGGIIELTESGRRLAGTAFENLPRKKMARSWTVLVHNALKARIGLKRDVDYVVQSGEVQIVDANTGRIHDERRWQGGLHQAVEVAAGLEPSIETLTQARITRQRYCQYYDKLSGLTGTAGENVSDFREFYGLDTDIIPTHRPSQRQIVPVRYFANHADKMRFIVDDAMKRSRNGQPVLIGTRSIKESNAVASAFNRAVTLLNGVQDEIEADVVSRAGQAGAITIATNMAGRGTDIAVDGQAKAAGGLHVIATEHQDSPRVDRQLAGRAARQGDPGSVQFLACPQDTLIENHDPKLAATLAGIQLSTGITAAHLDSAIAGLQRDIDRKRFEMRRQMVARDAWLENIQNTLAKTG